jgi:hypothetical protein
MSYFDEGCTLPPPFNVIISPKSVYYFVKAIQGLLAQLYSRPKSPKVSMPRPATAEKGLLVVSGAAVAALGNRLAAGVEPVALFGPFLSLLSALCARADC